MMRERNELGARKEAEMAALLASCHGMIADGISREEVLAYLHQARTTTSGNWPNTLEAMVFLRDLYGVSLQEALGIIQGDPSWRGEASSILS